MKSAPADGDRLSVSGWLLLVLVAALPLMKPAIFYPIVLPDLVFPLLLAALASEIASGRRVIGWDRALAILIVYALSLAPSLLATPDVGRSAFKLATEAYLVGLAMVAIVAIRSEAMLRRIVLTWLAATAGLALLALVSLIGFMIAPDSGIYGYGRFHFGTLPPGNYPRLALTFFNANMACNYLTVSLGLLFVAWRRGWIGPWHAWPLLGGILLAALLTLSPGLGGIALALGTGAWLMLGWRFAMIGGALVALAFLLAAAVTPIVHSTAPFLIELPGMTLAPSGRFLTWSAAATEFLRHPIIGHGIGIDAVAVRYADPSGNLQQLTDAHNVFLSIGAQAGLAGLAGLALLLYYAVRLCRSNATALLIGLTFLNAFVYHGMTGAFEDTRHLWVLFGVLVAAARLPINRSDGNSRTAGAPSPC